MRHCNVFLVVFCLALDILSLSVCVYTGARQVYLLRLLDILIKVIPTEYSVVWTCMELTLAKL